VAPIAQAVSVLSNIGFVPFDPGGLVPGVPPGLPCEIPTPIPGVVFCAGNCKCAGIAIPTPFGTGCALGSCIPPGPGNGFAPGGPPPPGDCPPGTRPVGFGGRCVTVADGNGGAPPGGGGGGCKVTGTQGAKILCPPGCHPNKAGYHLKSGAFVAEGSRCVTNRRRNPLNPRALDRAAGRLRSAQKAVKFLQAAKLPKRRRR